MKQLDHQLARIQLLTKGDVSLSLRFGFTDSTAWVVSIANSELFALHGLHPIDAALTIGTGATCREAIENALTNVRVRFDATHKVAASSRQKVATK